MKKQNGITLLSLIITIVMMMIIASATIFTSNNRMKVNNLNKLRNDLQLLQDRVAEYYATYGGLPVVKGENGEPLIYLSNVPAEERNEEDETYTDAEGNTRYKDHIIDLEALGDITLNFGKGYAEYKNGTTTGTSSDVYIINSKTHSIYYDRGIEGRPNRQGDTRLYYAYGLPALGETSPDNIPPTKPTINIVEGTLDESNEENSDTIGYYTTPVTLEFVPGKNKISEVTGTTYSIEDNAGNKIVNNKSIATLTNNRYELEDDGQYTITVTTTSENGETSSVTYTVSITQPFEPLQIGDYVDYRYISASDYSLATTYSGTDSAQTIKQNVSSYGGVMKWRVFKIDDSTGKVDLISEKPTEASIALKGAKGYNNGVYYLNYICKKHYSNYRVGVTARNINIEDIENYLNSTGKTARSNYTSVGNIKYNGTKTYYDGNSYYPYLYANEKGSGEGSTSASTSGIGVSEDTASSFTVPSTQTYTNKTVGIGLLRRGTLTTTQTFYSIPSNSESYFSNTTAYNLLFDTDSNYWVASRYAHLYSSYTSFGIRTVSTNALMAGALCNSAKSDSSPTEHLRPMVTLDASMIGRTGGTRDNPRTVTAN